MAAPPSAAAAASRGHNSAAGAAAALFHGGATAQAHVITVGAVGGALGAAAAPLLRRLAFTDADEAPRGDLDKTRHSYGLGILSNVVAGLMLPRLALAMDGIDYAPWNTFARLSSYL